MMNLSLLFTLVIVGLFLAALWAATRLAIEVFGWVLRGFRPRRPYRQPGGSAGMICPNRQCRYVNVSGANFCAQCGAALRVSYSASEYQ
jgi:hypothetical protein